MKKIIYIILISLVLNCLLVQNISAQESDDQQSTLVVGDVEREYVFTIPGNFIIPANSESTDIGDVTVVEMVGYPDEVLKVTLVTNGKLNAELPGISPISFNSTFDDVEIDLNNVQKPYPVIININKEEWKSAAKGRYSANLLFEASFYDSVKETADSSSTESKESVISTEIKNNPTGNPTSPSGDSPATSDSTRNMIYIMQIILIANIGLLAVLKKRRFTAYISDSVVFLFKKLLSIR